MRKVKLVIGLFGISNYLVYLLAIS